MAQKSSIAVFLRALTLVSVGVFALGIYVPFAQAQTWNGGGLSGNWSLSANWGGSAAPDSATATATFPGSSSDQSPNLNESVTLKGMTWSAAPTTVWTFTNSSGDNLTLGSGGITENGATGTVIFNGPTITLSANQTWEGGIELLGSGNSTLNLSNYQLTINNGSAGTAQTELDTAISGNGSILITSGGGGARLGYGNAGAGVSNTYSGGTTIQGNNVSILLNGSNTPLGSGALTFDSSTSGAPGLTFNMATGVTSATLANNWSANGGVATIQGGAAGTTLTLSGSGTINTTYGSTTSLSAGNTASTVIFSGNINGSGGITTSAMGAGNLVFTGSNNISSFTLNEPSGATGYVGIGSNAALGTGTVTLTSGNFEATTSGLILNNTIKFTNNTASTPVNFEGSQSLTMQGNGTVAGGTSYFETTSSGTLTLSGALTNSGSAATLNVLSSSTGALALSGGVSGALSLDYNGSGPLTISNNSFAGTGSLTINSSSPTTISANLSNSGGVYNTSSGTLNISGTLGLGSPGVFLNTGSGAVNISGAVNGATQITQSGSGTITFSGSSGNSQTGALIVSSGSIVFTKSAGVAAIGPGASIEINGGTLSMTNSNQTNSTNNVILGGGTLNVNGTSQVLGTLTLTGNSTIDVSEGGSVSFDETSASWTSSSVLTIDSWEGATNAITFSGSGLTTSELSQIQFLNPNGSGGTYSAVVSPSGVITPGPVIMAAVPEPSALAIGLILAVCVPVWEYLRRRKARSAGSLGLFFKRKKIRRCCKIKNKQSNVCILK